MMFTQTIITRLLWLAGICLVLAMGSCLTPEQKEAEKLAPSEQFYLQRTFPDTVFPLKAYEQAMDVASAQYLAKKYSASKQGGPAISWVNEGPGNIGGRINTIAVDANNTSVIYMGAAAGGLWKTVNGGADWNPIFDDHSYLAIGDIEIDPNNSNIVYVGTGDPNVSGYPFIGDGIYKSTDAGQTWTHLGLTDARIISCIEVHPTNSNIVYAATMGLPFERNSDRGLYKSWDGGQNWQKILYLSDSAGVIDLVLHPTDTNIIYATGWNRIRTPQESLITGPESLIYKSTDGGQNWTTIMTGINYTGYLSRINLDMYEANPNVLYASVIDSSLDLLGIYKTTNGGQNWTKAAASGLPAEVMNGFGWYFGKVKVNPANENQIFVLGVDLWRSNNGGSSWIMAGPPWYYYDVHADKHDLVFSQNGILLATDGGAYRSTDGGDNWTDIEDIPITQFYHVQVNPHEPGIYYGGAQDNGTMSGNAAGFNNWYRVFGGDGFDVQFHPTDPSVFYAETQNGGLVMTSDGGYYFDDILGNIDVNDRRNWDMPYKLSYHNANTLFTGTHRMYRSTSGSWPSWVPVSNDLTKGPIWGAERNNISVIDESRTEPGYVYCGTSDGNVWRSTNNGNTWTDITGSLPFRYVTDVSSSYTTAGVIAVSHSGYKENDFIPHIHLSTDHGDTWTDISGDLPPLAINDVEISPYADSLIFVATDGGVYYTLNNGTNWERLGDNMPVITVYDIEIDDYNTKLIAGTHARSMMSIALDSIIAQLTAPPLIVQASGDDTICLGRNTQITVTGGSTVSWWPTIGLACPTCRTTDASPAATTTYIATVTDIFGSTATDSVQVTVKTGPLSVFISLFHDSLVANVSGTASTYQWYRNNVPISGATGPYHIATQNGNYRVEAYEANCQANSSNLNVVLTDVASIETPVVRVWASGSRLYTEMPGASLAGHSIQLVDLNGRIVFRRDLTDATGVQVFNVPNLSSGNYIVQLNGPLARTTQKVFLAP